MKTPHSLHSHSYSAVSPSANLPFALRLACLTAVLAAGVTLSACKKSPVDSAGVSSSANTSQATGTTISESTTLPETITTTAATTPAVTNSNGVPSVGWCNGESVNIRSGAGTDYSGIGGLKYGEKVTLLGREGDWYQIQFKSGVGYVNAQFIQSTEIVATETAVTTTAAAQ